MASLELGSQPLAGLALLSDIDDQAVVDQMLATIFAVLGRKSETGQPAIGTSGRVDAGWVATFRFRDRTINRTHHWSYGHLSLSLSRAQMRHRHSSALDRQSSSTPACVH